MTIKKIKLFYLKFILSPLKTIALWPLYFYGRIVLTLALRGIKLPGFESIKKTMPKNAISAYERQILVFEIKGWQFSIQKGPFWYRKSIEKILYLFQQNRFWILIFTKTVAAIFFISLPIGLFILIRAVLPVPERVPYASVSKSLPKYSNLKTEWLYTEAPFETISKDPAFLFPDKMPKEIRGVSITPVLEPQAPKGLIHFGIGYYPTKLNLIRGFLASGKTPILINRQRKSSNNLDHNGILRIQYYLFPSGDSDEHQCKIELFDDLGKLIATADDTTPQKYESSLNPISASWKQSLTPNIIPDTGDIKEFKIQVKQPPQKITVKVTPTDQDKSILDSGCLYALGDFSFEHQIKSKLKRRGVIFILVDTLREKTAYDKNIMPNLNEFASKSGITFLEHRAQGNMTVPSVVPLMTSRYAREIGPLAFNYAADEATRKKFYSEQHPLLATSMQSLGYRVGAIGWLSLFSEAMQGGMDLGFHNAVVSENLEYEARQITEQMGLWLENYGDAPFFLYLHYNTMHGPYKPPFSYLNLSKMLEKPFGLKPRKELYNALGHYWDDEFLNILKKLDDLGIKDDVDIIITADHGAQLDEKPWNYFSGVNKEITGAYGDKGHSLFDEEIHIPLILHLAHTPSTYGTQISTPTAHVDLFPTLYSLAGGISPYKNQRGLDLSAGLQENSTQTIQNITRNRNSIYFDGHRYAGILYWGKQFNQSPMKYIRQFEPDEIRLFLSHNPWSLNINWYQTEMYSSVNFNDHTETWLSFAQGDKLLDLRKAYIKASPSEKIVKITAKYAGPFSMTILSTSSHDETLLAPKKIVITKSKQGKNQTKYHFSGEMNKDESIEIHTKQIPIKKIHFGDGITAIACPNGISIDSNYLATLLEKSICSFFAPPDGIIEKNYSEKDRPVVLQQGLSGEQIEHIEGNGAGAALQKALREWGYTK